MADPWQLTDGQMLIRFKRNVKTLRKTNLSINL